MKLKILALLILFPFSAQLARADGLSLLGFATSAVHAREQHKEHHDFHPLTSIAVIGVGIAAAGVTVECSKPKNRDDDRCAAGRELVGINGHPTDLIYDRSADKLKSNLNKAGEPTPSGCAAHHIAAKTDKRAATSRSILDNCNVDIDDAVNGVFLPQKKEFECSGAKHTNLHTGDYHKFVEMMLLKSSSFGCGEVKNELSRIKRLLIDNDKIWE